MWNLEESLSAKGIIILRYTSKLERGLLRSRTSNAIPNLCWVFCALLGVLCN